MRKILIFLLFPLLMGCSSDDHEDEIVNEGIIGSWISENLSGPPFAGEERGFYIKTFQKDGRYYSHTWDKEKDKWVLWNKSPECTIIDDNIFLHRSLIETEYDKYRYEIKEVGPNKYLTLYLYFSFEPNGKEYLWGIYRKMSNKDIKESGITFD